MSTSNSPSPRVDSITLHFGSLPDPRRREQCALHSLHSIVTIAILAVISGAEGWEDMEQFGLMREAWLRTFLDLPYGIPSNHTFRRFFSRLRPKAFAACFTAWMQALVGSSEGKLIPIDGKTLRHSFDTATKRTPLHLVHAWSQDNQVLLGQFAVDAKSNEITAIPKLLELLDLRGALVTMDAMGTQREIAAQIVAQQGDYLLALRDNHPTMHREVLSFFEGAINTPEVRTLEHVDKDHGRLEVRRTYVSDQIAWFADLKRWRKLTSFVRLERERTVDGITTITHAHYLCSLSASDLPRIAAATRDHWSVENTLHWTLDVTFREDDSRIRTDHGPENFALLRRLALSLIRRDTAVKASVRMKRKRAAWNCDELLRLLQAALASQTQQIS